LEKPETWGGTVTERILDQTLGKNQNGEQQKGASMLEYALLAALIAVVCILAITFLGRQACISFSHVGSSFSQANG
jgi:pilus assembly protein Flp/PilA